MRDSANLQSPSYLIPKNSEMPLHYSSFLAKLYEQPHLGANKLILTHIVWNRNGGLSYTENLTLHLERTYGQLCWQAYRTISY